MTRVAIVETLGSPQLLRRTLAPPIRHIGFDTRVHSRRALGRALPRTAVPTPVSPFEEGAAGGGPQSDDLGCDGEDPERRFRS